MRPLFLRVPTTRSRHHNRTQTSTCLASAGVSRGQYLSFAGLSGTFSGAVLKSKLLFLVPIFRVSSPGGLALLTCLILLSASHHRHLSEPPTLAEHPPPPETILFLIVLFSCTWLWYKQERTLKPTDSLEHRVWSASQMIWTNSKLL